MIEPAQGDLAWRIERVDPTGYGMYNSIALDSSDRPHIGYGDNNTETLKYANRGPSGWSIQVVDSIREKGYVMSLLNWILSVALISATVPGNPKLLGVYATI